MKWLAKRISPVSRGEGGFTLIESLVAVAILGAIGVVFLVAMNAAYGSVGTTDERSQAEALIRTQLDYIKSVDYADSYPVTVTVPNQYSVTISVEVLDTIDRESNCTADSNCNTLQNVTVTVSRPTDGGDRTVLSISSYKVREWE